MSTSNMLLIIKKMIRHYGQEVKRQKRVRNEDDEEVYYTYTVEEPIRGQFTQITPTDEVFNRWGRTIDADYIGTFLPDESLLEGDLLYVNDGWYEVVNLVNRRTKGITDYKEALLRRKKG